MIFSLYQFTSYPKKSCRDYPMIIVYAMSTYGIPYCKCKLAGVDSIPKNQNTDSNEFEVEQVSETGVETIRVRLPKKRNREMFASADLMMGANHIRVRCIDGVTRMGRIKGKIKKRVWIREGDTLIVVPWSFQDEKCDIIYRYLKPQVDWLRRNKYL
jgi:translation initiation factor 1A